MSRKSIALRQLVHLHCDVRQALDVFSGDASEWVQSGSQDQYALWSPGMMMLLLSYCTVQWRADRVLSLPRLHANGHEVVAGV